MSFEHTSTVSPGPSAICEIGGKILSTQIATLCSSKAGFDLFDYQQEYLDAAVKLPSPQRALPVLQDRSGEVLHRTGQHRAVGLRPCVVVCPPSTHLQWVALGEKLGVDGHTDEPCSVPHEGHQGLTGTSQ